MWIARRGMLLLISSPFVSVGFRGGGRDVRDVGGEGLAFGGC